MNTKHPSTAEPSAVIECRNICVAYDREDVLHDICLSIPAGAFLPFVGPNGAGKTTLLRTILGLLKPRTGQVVTPFRQRPPGYVPQQRVLDPLFPMSLRRIVEMGLYPKLGCWKSPRRAKDAVDDVLDRFDLKKHENKTFRELSGGMRQKTLVARAYVSGADVMVMDEPTSELDEDSEHDVLAHLHRISTEHGKTVLLAHHGFDKIVTRATHAVIMQHGQARMERIADHQEVATCPDS